jgi:hypothetical protein
MSDQDLHSDRGVPELSPLSVLAAIASYGCQKTSSSGPGACFRNGKVPFARYEADAVCDGCLAWAATKHLRYKPYCN